MYRPIFAIMACAGLAGCLGGAAPQDPNFVETDVQSDGVTVIGSYDPDSFSSSDARKMAAFSCLGGDVASFTESDSGGKKVFEAVCASGTVHGAGSGVNFTRTGPKSATYSSVYSVNGTVTVSEGPFAL